MENEKEKIVETEELEKEKPVDTDEIDLQNLTVEQVEKMDDDELENIGKKKKKKTKRRKLETPFLKITVTVLTLVMSAFHLFAAIYSISPLMQRGIHLLFVMVLVFLLYPATPKSPTDRPSIFDGLLILLAIVSIGNLIVNFQRLAKSGGRPQGLDIYFGIIVVLLVLEGARRTVGLILPCMAIFMISYGFWGKFITGPLKHAGFSWNRIVRHLTLTTEGVYGTVLGVSSTFIFMFILFGAFLSVTGMTGVFNDIAMALAGGLRGGPAKVSVLASGLMGSVSGSASANVVTTGAFTIPLMKRTGYENYFAGSVEAVASTGGQIMPPVMGSAAFIMADSLGVPFLSVIKSALLPAILYYLSCWHMVDLRARKDKIRGLSRSELPNLWKVLKERGHLLIPLVGMIYMLVSGYNAMRAAVIAIGLSIISSFLRKSTRIKLKDLIKAMESGALNALSVASACAVIGILVGMFSLTGAIMTLGAAVLSLGQGLLLPTLILTMLVAIILGMGMPTTACYVLTSTVAAPAIIKLGVPDMAAHMFVFYYGILSAITPPVATAAYTAAGLSGSNPNKTGFSAVRLATTGFIIPFMFVYCPELLLLGDLSFLTIVRVVITALIGVFALGIGVEGFYFRKLILPERIACFAAAFLLINSSIITDIIGVAIIGVEVALQFMFKKQHPEAIDF